MFELDSAENRLFVGSCLFDPASRRWTDIGHPSGNRDPLNGRQALHWLQTRSGYPVRAPIGVIGPNDAGDDMLKTAHAVGGVLAQCGLTVLCGGRQGVMEAVCHGASDGGGQSLALLPGRDADAANPYASLVLTSGIGEARNALIAQASACLVAVGDSFGTLSEVALGLRLGKAVFGLCGAAPLSEVRHLSSPDVLADALARHLFGLDDPGDRATLLRQD